MAFPIPSHLPRRPSPLDVSSQILSKIDSATTKTLDSALATSWLVELDATIESTKERIHERIQADLPEFNRQLDLSKSVQTRFHSLTTNVDTLNDVVSDPSPGIISTLLGNLTSHARLAQEASDAQVKFEALSHLLRCKTSFQALTTLIQAGKLSEAAEACDHLNTLLEGTPTHLNQTGIMVDLKTKFRAAHARIEDQLSDALSRSIIIAPTELTILSSVQVRQSETVLSLHSILLSLSHNSLSNHLTTLRRDLMIHFIDHVLKQPVSILESSGGIEHKLSHIPSPPNEEIRTQRLDNVSAILTFLSAHFLSSLPPSHSTFFTHSLCKPITTSILNNILIAFLPSSFDQFPRFMELAKQAVRFEDQFIVDMLRSDSYDRPVKVWADGVSGHYERQRRSHILNTSRTIIISSEGPTDTFFAEIEIPSEVYPPAVPIQIDSEVEEQHQEEGKSDAWGFDEEPKPEISESLEIDEDGWGFDDDPMPEPQPIHPSPSPEIINAEDETDPSEAWGWNDDDAPLAEESAWDDPWADNPTTPGSSTPSSPTNTRPPPEPTIASPKIATRLEKAVNKNKKHLNGTSMMHSPESPPPLSSFQQQLRSMSVSNPTLVMPQSNDEPLSSGKRPLRLMMSTKETYLVSERMKQVIDIVENVLDEGRQFTASTLFSSSESASTPGTTILQSAPAVLDLYMALYPVKFAKELEAPDRGMRFSNDCSFLSSRIELMENRLSSNIPSVVRDGLSECKHHLKIWGDSWYYDVIQKQRQLIDDILVEGAKGFTYSGDQDRYDDCESALSQSVQEIKRLAQRLKGVLAKSKYYTAIGTMADAVLSRVLQDILALPDIPEMESHRLNELCHILNALEGLFVEDPTQASFVVAYVPSWLKFSYLSELLEASMADITYLFEEGALVDFDVEELVRLVRALFADTALRTTTINKLLGGHPMPSS
ncbi:Centromere/kinetochore Zw10-domain-containing protein [Collybia nuda]|uniref:Centromere/kinetochore Zw10-domain-containing protein n=1 Tax=Collybia nuda TaxID=64659 RepID=A0A9P5YDZ6_9AGAR|nr:Centromere/kinetochore Zw10-domain-containing protein [Collybia nuda]